MPLFPIIKDTSTMKSSEEVFNTHRISVFFNKPIRPVPVNAFIDDILAAQDRIVIASAWFTDYRIAQAFIDSPAILKIAILNRSDLKRDNSSSVLELLKSYFGGINYKHNTTTAAQIEELDSLMDTAGELYGYEIDKWPQVPITKKIEALSNEWYKRTGLQYGYHQGYHGIHILGGNDFKEGVMHHKFILVDHLITWLGSYNFTFQAQKNYELLLRMEDERINSVFFDESIELADETIWNDTDGGYNDSANGAFRCDQCKKILPETEIGDVADSHGGPLLCKRCLG